MKKIQKLAITADVDSLHSIYAGRGLKKKSYSYDELAIGLQNMKSMAEKFDFKWTLFIVGHDLENSPNYASHLQDMVSSGHEIACHSMTHPQGFRFLSQQDKKEELESFDRIVKDKLGVKAVGFRSPGWNISDDMAEILMANGYKYDSSVFPTFLSPILKFLHWKTMASQPKKNRTTLGPLNYMFAPREPYRSEKKRLNSQGQNGILEFPIPVTPVVRLPFFATYHLARGYSSFCNGFEALMRKAPAMVHYQFHLSDFVDYSDPIFNDQVPTAQDGVYVPKSLQTPLEQKTELWGKILRDLRMASEDAVTLQEVPIRDSSL